MEYLKQADETIADNIVRLRHEKELSQYVVAARLQAMGLNFSRSRLSMIERKQRAIPASLVVGLCIIFKCEYGEMLGNLRQRLLENIE